MKKRGFAITLSLLLLSSMLSGCGSSKTSTTSPTQADTNQKYDLIFWTLFSGGDGDVMNKVIKTFNDGHPNIQIKAVPLDWGQYYTKLEAGVTANKGPDIGVSHITKLPELVDQGLIYNLDDYTTSAKINWDTFSPNILKASMFDGKHYSIPIDTHPFIFFYNKTLLKNAGMLDDKGKPIMEPGADGFVKFLTTLKSKLPTGVAPYAFPTNGDDPYRLWWALYNQLGGKDIISADGKSGKIDMDPAIKAANYIKDLYQKYKVIPLNLADFGKTFQSQKAAIFTSGVWNINTFTNTQGLDFDAMPLPKLFDNSSTWGDSHNLILPIQKNPDKNREAAAVTFMNWVAENGQIWGEAGHIPTKTTVQQSDVFKSLPKRANFVDAVNNVVIPKQSAKTWPINTAMIKGLDTIWNGSKQPEAVLTDLSKQITKLLNQ